MSWGALGASRATSKTPKTLETSKTSKTLKFQNIKTPKPQEDQTRKPNLTLYIPYGGVLGGLEAFGERPGASGGRLGASLRRFGDVAGSI